MGINKKMPSQEIGLYKIAKEAKALKEVKKELNKTMMISNAISMSKEMNVPMHNIVKKK